MKMQAVLLGIFSPLPICLACLTENNINAASSDGDKQKSSLALSAVFGKGLRQERG